MEPLPTPVRSAFLFLKVVDIEVNASKIAAIFQGAADFALQV
jgi:hypothetical protein